MTGRTPITPAQKVKEIIFSVAFSYLVHLYLRSFSTSAKTWHCFCFHRGIRSLRSNVGTCQKIPQKLFNQELNNDRWLDACQRLHSQQHPQTCWNAASSTAPLLALISCSKRKSRLQEGCCLHSLVWKASWGVTVDASFGGTLYLDIFSAIKMHTFI